MIRFSLACVVALFLQSETRAQSGIRFFPMGRLPDGGAFSVANAVSQDGRTVVGHGIDENGFYRAIRWTATDGMQSLGGFPSPSQSRSFALAVSADGRVITVQNVDQTIPHGPSESGLWSEENGLHMLGRFPGGEVGGSIPSALSGNGLVIAGQADTPGPGSAFRWSAADGWEDLGVIAGGSNGSSVRGASYDGSVLVGQSRSPNTSSIEGFRWTRETGMIGLGDLPGGIYKSGAEAVSTDGSVIVGYSRSGEFDEAFRWTTETGMVGLGFLRNTPSTSVAEAVSADGEIVVGWGGGPFIWDASHGIRPIEDILINEGGIDLSGWFLGRATGVAHLPDGTIVVCGYGDNPRQTEGWVAIIPSPSALSIVYVFGLAATSRRRRK